MKLTYNTPASDWRTGLFLGNGRLGALWLGVPDRKQFILNHKRIWTHLYKRELKPVSRYLSQVRKLIGLGKWKEAEELFCQKVQPREGDTSGGPSSHRLNVYQPAGELLLKLSNPGKITEYTRELNLDTAVATERFYSKGIVFQSEAFISAIHQVLAIHLTCDQPGQLEIQIRRPYDMFICSTGGRFRNNNLTFLGHMIPDCWFGIGARVLHQSGSIMPGGSRDGGYAMLTLEGAEDVWILLAIATEEERKNPLDLCEEHLNRAEEELDTLKERHIIEHQRLYRRAYLQLGTSLPDKPTDKIVEEVRLSPSVPSLFYALLFNYARYLLIACSRPGSWPVNNQGIWCGETRPPEETDMHLDLNLQQIYWPSEVSNLGECHLSFLDFLKEMVPFGQEAAQKIFGCQGIYLGLGIDGQSAIMGGQWLAWTGAAAWCAQHFWQHWEYTPEKGFLRDKVYPYLKEVAAFYLDFLIKDEKGYYVTCPSVSPEQALAGRNTQLFGRPTGWAIMGMNATMDIALITEVFTNLLAASEKLGVDADLRPRWRDILAHLAPWPIDEEQGIREFPIGQEPVADVAFWGAQFIIPAHLYGFFPGDSISVEETPELIEAVRKALFLRPLIGIFGEGQPWRACCWARLYDANNALCILDDVVKHAFSRGLCGVNNWGQSSPDNASAFVPDINTGVAIAVAEMLLQSHRGVIRILPAIPENWDKGEVKGWRARGGFELDFSWRDGCLEHLKVISIIGGSCRIRFYRPHPVIDLHTTKGEDVKTKRVSDNEVIFETVKGETYMLFNEKTK